MQISRRKFFKVCAGGMAGTSAAMLGFAPASALAAPREYKLLRAFESRNTCTYCAVSCGMLLYSTGKPYDSFKQPHWHQYSFKIIPSRGRSRSSG